MEKRNNLFSGNSEFSVLLVEKSNGVIDGIAFTHAANGSQSLGYIRLFSSFKIGQSKVSEYALPVMSLYGQGKVSTNHLREFSGLDFWFYFVRSTVVIIDKFKDLADSLTHDDDTDETDETAESN